MGKKRECTSGSLFGRRDCPTNLPHIRYRKCSNFLFMRGCQTKKTIELKWAELKQQDSHLGSALRPSIRKS